MAKYDYIITGAGAAGLSLLMRIIHSQKFNDKKILLVDRLPKSANDRTWCFWEKEAGFFDEIVFRRWSHLWFHTREKSKLHDIAPYEYKLIRGIDFYNYCFNTIKLCNNITILYGNVQQCFSDQKQTGIVLDGERIYAEYVFNSVLFQDSILTGRHHFLLQHFKGRFIRSSVPSFNPNEATLMDFRTGQQNGTAFLYVMPFSETEALVEYTLFSANVLDDVLYDEGLDKYFREFLKLKEYTVVDTEFGMIPMTNYPFQSSYHGVINIGTAGGQTKGSTGYTFSFIQKHSEQIVDALISTGKPFRKDNSWNRFDFYDSVLLNILANNRLKGYEVFSHLMRGNDLKKVMKFLDNDTNFVQEIQLIRNLPKKAFLRAAKEEIFRR